MTEIFKNQGLLMIGFALQLALSLSMLWDPLAILSVSPSLAGAFADADSTLRAFCLPVALGLTTGALFLGGDFGRRCMAVLFDVLLMVAIALLLLVWIGWGDAQSLLLMFSVLAPVAFGGIFAFFYGYLMAVPSRDFVAVVLCSSVMSGVATLLVQSFLAPVLLGLLGISFGIVFLALEFAHRSVFSEESLRGEGGFSPADLVDSLRPLMCFALCALVAGLMRTQVFGDPASMALADSITKVLCPTGALILIFFSQWLSRPAVLDRLYDVLFPLTVTLYMLLPLLGPRYGMALLVIDMFVFFLLSPLLIISSRSFAARCHLNAGVVCGVFAIIYYLASAIGSALGLCMASRGSYEVVLLLVIALMALWVLALVGHLLPRRSKGSSEEIDPSRDPFGDALDYLQSEFGLTPREREVAGLIVRGRSVKFIAEAFCLSPSTVQSHTKTLYRKLDIHSKQELVDLVEERNARL